MENITYVNMCSFLKDNYDQMSIIKKKYLKLCKQLSDSPDISDFLFIKNILKINENGIMIIAYIGDPSTSNFDIISTGTIFIEPKMIHGGRPAAHIEDIIVDQKYTGNGIARRIIELLKTHAIENGCYKIILNCNAFVKPLYEKCGFTQKGLQMALYL